MYVSKKEEDSRNNIWIISEEDNKIVFIFGNEY